MINELHCDGEVAVDLDKERLNHNMWQHLVQSRNKVCMGPH